MFLDGGAARGGAIMHIQNVGLARLGPRGWGCGSPAEGRAAGLPQEWQKRQRVGLWVTSKHLSCKGRAWKLRSYLVWECLRGTEDKGCGTRIPLRSQNWELILDSRM